MEPRIETIEEKKLIGMCIRMSLADDKTYALWQNFMQCRKQHPNTIGNDLYSVKVYDEGYFLKFKPESEFEKWAAVEVNNFDTIPLDFKPFIIVSGLYAVFNYVGAASNGGPFFQYIYQTWLPNSEYVLDNRPQFEILGAKYKNEDPASEEEIWIPLKKKNAC